MKRWKRCAAALLCACLTLPAVTAHAATEATARVKKLSGDLVSGYYVVFEMNGHEYRTDLCGESMNYGLWLRCSDEDKKAVMENYAFYPSARMTQFGYANSQKMCDWVDGDTGWKQARDVLADRIARRDFNKLWTFYDGENSDYASRADIGKNDAGLKAYDYLGEVRDYFQLTQTMQELYNEGESAYSLLRDAKSYQTSTAIMSTSGDLISFITERALVPGITPGGMAALAPSIKGEVQGLLDKCTGFSDTITSTITGEKLDAKTARKIIDAYWQIITVRQSMAEYCVDTFLDLKAKKSAAYDEAMEAIQFEKDREAGNLTEALGSAGDRAMAEYTPTTESGTWESLAAEFDSTMDQFIAWRDSTFGDGAGTVLTTFKNRLNNIERKFNAWPVLDRTGGFGPLTYNLDDKGTYGIRTFYMPDGRFALWKLHVNSPSSADPTGWSHFSRLRTELPEALDGCISELDELIGALDSYVDDYADTLDILQETWLSYESRLSGLLDAMYAPAPHAEGESYTRRYFSVPTMKTEFERLFNNCAKRQVGSDWLTLDDYKKYLEEQKKYYQDVRKTFVEDCAAYEAELRAGALRYQALQDRLADCHSRWLEAYNAHAALVAETEEIYYTASRKNEASGKLLLSDDLDLQFRKTDRSPESLEALFAPWGQDLADRVARLDEYRRTAENIKGERDLLLKQLSGNLVLYNEILGGGLRSRSELENDWMDLYQKDRAWTSEEMVRQACGEFTGSNAFTFYADTSLEEASWLKFNYLRGDEDARSTISNRISRLASNMADGMMGGGVRYERAFPYAYWLLRNPVSDQLYGELYAWKAELDSYRPVTGLRGPLSLMDDEPAHVMGVGSVWNLGKLVSVVPADATYQDLVWASSDSDVCTVDGNGLVTAVDSGTATIRVRSLDCTRTASKTDAGEEVVTYDPEPLTFTVRVGTGTSGEYRAGDVIWKNYGTDEAPQFCCAIDNGDGPTSVSCALRKDTYEPMDIVAALYDGRTGQMLALSCFSREVNEGYHVFAKTVPNENGLQLKVFSLSSDGSLLPLGDLLLNEEIPAAGG